jgi:hypothetical protein
VAAGSVTYIDTPPLAEQLRMYRVVWLGTDPGPVPPTVPVITMIESGISNTVRVTWFGPQSGYYRLQYASSFDAQTGAFDWQDLPESTTNLVAAGSVSYIDTPPLAEQLRMYRVVWLGTDPNAVPPTAPAQTSMTDVTPTSFVANWSASPGATNYFIDVSSSSDFAGFVAGYANLSVGNVTSVTVTGLTFNTTYYWRVRAAGPGGASESSGIATTNTLPDAGLVFAITMIESGISNTVKVTWYGSQSGYYRLQYASSFDAETGAFDWQDVPESTTNLAAAGSATYIDTPPLTEHFLMYRVVWLGSDSGADIDVKMIEQLPGGQVRLSIHASRNGTYRLQAATVLQAELGSLVWSNVTNAAVQLNSSGDATLTDASPDELVKLYRVIRDND